MKLFALLLLTMTFPALAQTVGGYAESNYISDPTLYDRFVSLAPAWLVATVPIMVALMIAFRGISEALWIVALKTENKTDDRIAEITGKIAAILAKITGAIGIGLPKTQLMIRAEQIALKESANEGKSDVDSTGPKDS